MKLSALASLLLASGLASPLLAQSSRFNELRSNHVERLFMKNRRLNVIYAGLVSTTLLLTATTARADEFMDACMMNSAANPGMAKICSCMSANVSEPVRADAAVALRKSNQATAEGGAPLDPSTLPANLQKGMQAIVLAQAQCM